MKRLETLFCLTVNNVNHLISVQQTATSAGTANHKIQLNSAENGGTNKI